MTIPHIEAIYEKYKDKNVVVLGVNLDTGDLEKLRVHRSIWNEIPCITDPKSAVAGKYMVNSIPTFLLSIKRVILRKQLSVMTQTSKILSLKKLIHY